MLNTKLKRIPLISIDTNAKTVKGQKEGFLTGILYMAPANLSGYNTCAMAEEIALSGDADYMMMDCDDWSIEDVKIKQ